MTEKRCYPVSREYLLNLICDIIELQNGKDVQSDSASGYVRFVNRMYGFRHEYSFTLLRDDCRYCVFMETDGERREAGRRLQQMFALLESLMTPIVSPIMRTDGYPTRVWKEGMENE